MAASGARFTESSGRGHARGLSQYRALLPEVLTILGLPGQQVICDPRDGSYYAWDPPGGTILCSNVDGDELFFVRPIADAGDVDGGDSPLHVRGFELWEDFSHQLADRYYNAIVKPFRKPQPRGQLAIMTYHARKDIDDEARGKLTTWAHHFDPESYPNLFSVGRDQFYVPPGAWRVTRRGIVNEGE